MDCQPLIKFCFKHGEKLGGGWVGMLGWEDHLSILPWVFTS